VKQLLTPAIQCDLAPVKINRGGNMVDFLMLIAASVGSMAFGVLAAYGIFHIGFALMRTQTQIAPVKAVQPRVPIAS
jgi:hypothetical protein